MIIRCTDRWILDRDSVNYSNSKLMNMNYNTDRLTFAASNIKSHIHLFHIPILLFITFYVIKIIDMIYNDNEINIYVTIFYFILLFLHNNMLMSQLLE